MARKWTRGKNPFGGHAAAAAAVVSSWLYPTSKDPTGGLATADGAEVDEAASTSGAEVTKSEVCRRVEQTSAKSEIQSPTRNAQTPGSWL
jgi:hypothetical protein